MLDNEEAKQMEYIDLARIEEVFFSIQDCCDMVFDDDMICQRINADCGSCRWREAKEAIRKKILRLPRVFIPDEEANDVTI